MAEAALATAAVLSAGTGVAAAVQQDSAQRKARQMQRAAQATAEKDALKQERNAKEATARATQRTPNIAGLLADAQKLRAPATIFGGANQLLGQ
jgi:uncharacterized protein HemX